MGIDITYLRLVEIVFSSDRGAGYVMDFTNNTLHNFIIDKVDLDIYSDKYSRNGNSKMKRLKILLHVENNRICGYLLLHLLKYKETNYSDIETSISSQQFKKLIDLANNLSGKKVTRVSKSKVSPKRDYKSSYNYTGLLNSLYELSSITNSQKRGYEFEKFLEQLFGEFHLQPKGSFKVSLTKEQIDGSFLLDNETYIVEAKYTSNNVPTSDLILFNSKIRGYSRGLFITFSDLNNNSDSIHITTNGGVKFICITVKEIIEILYQKQPLDSFLRARQRVFNETGKFYYN